MYPALAAFEQGGEEHPKQVESSPQPGRIDIGLRFYLLSITAESDASPRAGAQREARRLAAIWRKNFYNVHDENTTMQGRVHDIRIAGWESADLNRLGYAMAVDMDTGNYLWVYHFDIEVYP